MTVSFLAEASGKVELPLTKMGKAMEKAHLGEFRGTFRPCSVL